MDDGQHQEQQAQHEPGPGMELAFPDLKPGDAWGESIAKWRVDELEAMLQRWEAEKEHTRRRGPFDRVKLNGADVFWLVARALAGTSEQDPIAAYKDKLLQALVESDLGPNLSRSPVHLEGADLVAARLRGAILAFAHLEGSDLWQARLEGAHLWRARLEGSRLSLAHLEGAYLVETHLEGADLRLALLDSATIFARVFLGDDKRGYALLAAVRWRDVNLTAVNWNSLRHVGDDRHARRSGASPKQRVLWYSEAANAYHLLSMALRAQGLTTDATRFHFRAELMDRYAHLYDFLTRLRSFRSVLTAPAAFGRWFLSFLLGTLAGYGDRLGRLFLTYLVVVTMFAGLMFAVAGQTASPDTIRDVYVLSVTSFHGRGVQPPGLPLSGSAGDALATLAAIEAFAGLTIEGLFIAAFTRRVTGG